MHKYFANNHASFIAEIAEKEAVSDELKASIMDAMAACVEEFKQSYGE